MGYCYHPYVFKDNGIKDNGKKDLEFVSSLDDFYLHGSLLTGKQLRNPEVLKSYGYVLIPCGQCIGCRLQYSRNWANRLMLASKDVIYKYFITLTYSDAPVNHVVDINSGEVIADNMTLVKDDVQKFIKRLRKYADLHNLKAGHIQYYLAGEYGPVGGRPHYHLILFNFYIPDLELEYVSNGYEYKQSKIITDLWKLGRTQVCSVNWDTCAYVARYVMKKVRGPTAKDYYGDKCIIPEFVLMSRNPAIGRDYYDKNKYDIYKDDSIYVSTDEGGLSMKPSRYYDKLFDIDNHVEMVKIKKQRERSVPSSRLYHTDKYYVDYLHTLESVKENSIKILKRGDL